MSSDERLGAEQTDSGTRSVVCFGPFAFDQHACRLTRDGAEVHLTPKAAGVLAHLLQNPGDLVTKDEFLDVVWEDVHVREESLTQAISAIRRAIGDPSQGSEFIQTVPGRGYRFIATIVPNGDKGSPTPVAGAGDQDPAPDPSDDQHDSETHRRRWSDSLPLAWGVAAVATVVAIGAVAVALLQTPGEQPGTPASESDPSPVSMPFFIDLPEEAPLAAPGSLLLGIPRRSLALSPDGLNLVYVADVGGDLQLYRRDMKTGRAHAIPGTNGAQDVATFSPDSRSIAFFADGKLKTVAFSGGEPTEIADAVWAHGAEWDTNGFIYLIADELAGVLRVDAAGNSAPEPVTQWDVGSSGHAWPSLIPGHDLLLYTGEYFPPRVMLTTLAGFEPIELFPGTDARYLPSGHLVWMRHGQWMGAPFDPDSRALRGEPSAILDDVRRGDWMGQVHATWSKDGTLVYAPGSSLATARFVLVDENSGVVEPLRLPPATYSAFALSPDGSKLAYTKVEALSASVWLYDLQTHLSERLSDGPADRVFGWVHDGAAVLVVSRRPDGGGLYRIGVAAGDRERVELIGEAVPNGMATADSIVYQTATQDVALAPFGPDGRSVELLDTQTIRGTQYLESFPAVSPDGKWLAYMSDETETWETWVVDLTDGTRRRRVSTDWGEEPRWSPDGRRIIYRSGMRWFSRTFSADPEVTLGPETRIFQGPYINVGGYSWDVSRADGRFLVLENPDLDRALTELHGMTNFFEFLEERLPVNGRES